MRRIVVISVLSLLIAFVAGQTGVSAQAGKGLSVSPLRQQLTVAADKTSSGYFIVADNTDKPMNVAISIKKFSVTDYSYDYTFQAAQDGWIKPQRSTIQLKPGQSAKAWYDITVPAKATPGGYYYALIASTKVAGGSGLPETIQAATMLYLTVDGKLVRTSVLKNDSIPFWVTGSSIPYRFDVKDTGNVYFSAYFYGQLQGLFGTQTPAGTSHLLLPGAVRTIEGSIPSPLLPGIYKVTYGYKVDFASIIISKSAYIVYIPPWSVVALLFIVLLARWVWQKKRKKPQPEES